MKKLIVTALAVASLAAMAPGALADGGRRVEREGPWSGQSDWKLRAENKDGGLRVRWEVDSQIPGQTWNLQLRHNGNVVASATRQTNADGEAQLNLTRPNLAGPDTFKGTATRPANGETCAGTVTF